MQLRFMFAVLFIASIAFTACDSKGGLVTANNPLNPTTGPTATAAPPTPTPTPTSIVPAACAAPPIDPNTVSITLTGFVQAVNVPCFSTFTATASIPANSSAGATVALKTSADQNFGAVVNGADGTPILYTSLQPSVALHFLSTTATIATVVTSSTIGAPHTYTVEAYVPALGVALQTVPGIVPVGDTVSYALNTQGGSFPAVQVVVILYQSS